MYIHNIHTYNKCNIYIHEVQVVEERVIERDICTYVIYIHIINVIYIYIYIYTHTHVYTYASRRSQVVEERPVYI
jgi:hypothetical protein